MITVYYFRATSILVYVRNRPFVEQRSLSTLTQRSIINDRSLTQRSIINLERQSGNLVLVSTLTQRSVAYTTIGTIIGKFGIFVAFGVPYGGCGFR